MQIQNFSGANARVEPAGAEAPHERGAGVRADADPAADDLPEKAVILHTIAPGGADRLRSDQGREVEPQEDIIKDGHLQHELGNPT